MATFGLGAMVVSICVDTGKRVKGVVVPRFWFSFIQRIASLVHLVLSALGVWELVVDLVLVNSLFLHRRSMKRYRGSDSFRRQKPSRSDIPIEQGLKELSLMQLTLLGCVAVAIVGYRKSTYSMS